MMEDFVEQRNIYEISLPEETNDRLLLQIKKTINLLKGESVGFLFIANHCNVTRLEKYLKEYISLKANSKDTELKDSEDTKNKETPKTKNLSKEITQIPEITDPVEAFLEQQLSADKTKAKSSDETDEITMEKMDLAKKNSHTAPSDETDKIPMEKVELAKNTLHMVPSDETDEIIPPILEEAFEVKTKEDLATHLEMFCADLLAIKDKFHKISQLKAILRKNFEDLFRLVKFCDSGEEDGIKEALYGCIDNETDERMLAVWVQNLTKFYLPSLKRNYRYYLSSGNKVKIPLDSVLNILGTTI